MRAELVRNTDSEFGVFGHLHVYDDAGNRIAHWCTAEDDWLGNLPGVSCIPSGTYECRRTIYQKHGIPTFEITGVPNRSRILIHPGNTEEDTQGCVLLGMDFGANPVTDEDDPKGGTRLKWAVVRSKDAFAAFMAAMHNVNTFSLEVTWSKPGEWRAA